MRRGWNKLKSRSGASILFAILVFMLCILAGTAALTAAAANSGRYTHLKAEQQKYLTVSSAAKLLRDQVAGKTLVVTKETKTSAGGSPGTPSYDYNYSDPLTGSFYNIIEATLKNVAESSVGTGATPIKLTVEDSDSTDPKFSKVNAELTISNNYSMSFTVYYPRTVEVSGGVSTTEPDYSMTVNIPAVVTKSTETKTEGGVTTTTETTTVEWTSDSATIAYGG